MPGPIDTSDVAPQARHRSAGELPRLGVVVVNFNGRACIAECLRALSASTLEPAAVLVIDNASTDGSVELVTRDFPHVRVIRESRNLGFAGGANAGIRWCLAADLDAVLLLNPDAFVEPGALQALAEASRARPHALLGPMVVRDDDPRQSGAAGASIAWWRGQSVRPPTVSAAAAVAGVRVDALIGCSLLLPRGAVLAVGELDERYFLYAEDLDYCARAAAAGWSLWIVPAAIVRHREGQATGGRASALAMYYFVRNRHRLVFLHRFPHPVCAAFVAYETLDVLARVAVAAWRGQSALARGMWRGWLDGWRGLSGPRPA